MPGEEAQRLPRRCIAKVGVVEHHHQRGLLRQAPQHVSQPLQQPGQRGFALRDRPPHRRNPEEETRQVVEHPAAQLDHLDV